MFGRDVRAVCSGGMFGAADPKPLPARIVRIGFSDTGFPMFDGIFPLEACDRASGRVAVIGSGIAGLSAALQLSEKFRVTLFEADRRLGGHSNTVVLDLPEGPVPVDTGFIVYNERTYPNLTRLFQRLDVPTADSDMSFSVSRPDGLEYAASSHLPALFARWQNATSPRFLWMLREVCRFQRDMQARLAVGDLGDKSLGEVVAAGGYSRWFRDHYLVPMGAAVWSGSSESILDFPAETYLRFCLNHGMLTMTDRPAWRTVQGGSREYVRRVAARLADIRLATPVHGITRHGDKVALRTARSVTEIFDHVVLAAHSDQCLRLLDDADDAERGLLSQIRYQPNQAVLHTDASLMPRRRRAWSSWNVIGNPGAPENPVSLTYWMNRLQPLATQRDVFVTLNPPRAPEGEYQAFAYAHPQFDQAALAAQRRLHEIQGRRHTWFCGAWCGHGFHEDGLVSGLTVARWLGAPAAWQASRGVDRVPMAAHDIDLPAISGKLAA